LVIGLSIKEALGRMFVLFVIVPGLLAGVLYATQPSGVVGSILTLYYVLIVIGMVGLSAKR